MAPQTGVGSTCQMGKEGAYGSAAAGTHPINFTSESMRVSAIKTDEGSLISSLSPTARDLMGLSVAGDLGFVLRPEFAGFLLHKVLGGADTATPNSGGVTGYTKHALALAAADGAIPSSTIIIGRKVSVRKYTGCKVESFSLDAKAGDYVKGSVSFKGKDESSGSLASLTALSLRAFKMIGATLVLGGTTYDVSSASLKIANKLQEMPRTFGSGLYLPEPPHGMREIMLDFEIPYDTAIDTLADTNFVTETNLATGVLTLLSPSMVTGTSPYKVVANLANLAVLDVTKNVSGSGVTMAKVSCIALHVGSTAPLGVDVYDGTATAYSA